VQEVKLKFLEQPLVNSTIRLSLGEPLPVNLAFVFDLARTFQAAGAEEWTVDDLEALPVAPGTHVNYEPTRINGFRFVNTDGVVVVVSRALLSVQWDGGPVQDRGESYAYPGFTSGLLPTLEQLVLAIEDLVGEGSLKFRVSNMSYQFTLGLDEIFQFIEPFDSKLLNFGAIDNFQLAMRCPDAIEHRITIRPSDASGTQRIVETAAGIIYPICGFQDAKRNLGDVHNRLLETFNTILTPYASEAWKRQ